MCTESRINKSRLCFHDKNCAVHFHEPLHICSWVQSAVSAQAGWGTALNSMCFLLRIRVKSQFVCNALGWHWYLLLQQPWSRKVSLLMWKMGPVWSQSSAVRTMRALGPKLWTRTQPSTQVIIYHASNILDFVIINFWGSYHFHFQDIKWSK